MKLLLLLILLSITSHAYAEFYKYTDNNGILVLVDDINKIPPRYWTKTRTAIGNKKLIEPSKHGTERSQTTVTRIITTDFHRSPGNTTKVTINDNKVIIPVYVSNKGITTVATLLMDTGSQRTSITPDLANKLNASYQQSATVRVADGRSINAYISKIETLTVGPRYLKNMDIIVFDSRGPQNEYDGILGMDFLKLFKHQLDFNNQTITWF
jgi:predicted aspartyl protease